ncbi:UbiA family prenyltransferase [Candidatus Gottesmanbacteria bacterium]|nr:UbiA family prenyltransferase [Candidatus Gottesmanbacteria bacterium]
MKGSLKQIKRTIKGLIRLSRYRDYQENVVIATLLGLLFSGTDITSVSLLRFGVVLIANLLGVGFSYMINDIEDASDDALITARSSRNPISDGTLSPRIGYLASFFFAGLSAFFYFILGFLPFLLGISSLILGALYSWRAVRLKRIPVLDLISHGLMLGVLQLSCAFYVFVPFAGFSVAWLLPAIFVLSISIHDELYNEIRDVEIDRKVGIIHTASIIGEKAASFIMNFFLLLAGLTIFYSIANRFIPWWFIVLLCGSYILFLGYRHSQGLKLRGELQKPLLQMGILSILVLILIRAFEI